LIERKLKSSK